MDRRDNLCDFKDIENHNEDTTRHFIASAAIDQSALKGLTKEPGCKNKAYKYTLHSGPYVSHA